MNHLTGTNTETSLLTPHFCKALIAKTNKVLICNTKIACCRSLIFENNIYFNLLMLKVKINKYVYLCIYTPMCKNNYLYTGLIFRIYIM